MVSWVSMFLLVLFLASMRPRRFAPQAPLQRCASCRYSLVGLPENACCPECGLSERIHPPPRSRVYFYPRLGKFIQMILIFALVPFFWAAGNLAGTTFKYACVESFTAAWRNASLGIIDRYEEPAWLLELLTPSCVLLAVAVMIWPRRRAWTVTLVGLTVVAAFSLDSGVSLPSWHRQLDELRTTPASWLVLFALASVSFRFLDVALQSSRLLEADEQKRRDTP